MPQNNREVGAFWEKRVMDYLKSEGYIILAKNYWTRYSEIDVIAEDRDDLVFVEVKYRKTESGGSPLEAVTPTKQKRIRNAALHYLKEKDYVIDNTNIRFDVIGILGDEMTHIKNAF